MRHTPHFVMADPHEVRRLIANNPWATFVSSTSSGLVASHYPVILDETPESAAAESSDDSITILSHFGKPDEQLHELGTSEVLVIVQGPHDYVSPSWYAAGDVIPTWNHVTAHLYGVPEILDDEENYAVLSRLTDHFEHGFEHGRSLSDEPERTRRVARGTVGLRLRVTRFDARAKLSQNKAPEVASRVMQELDERNPALAHEMRRVHEARG